MFVILFLYVSFGKFSLVVDQFTPGYQFRPTVNFLEDLKVFIEKMFTIYICNLFLTVIVLDKFRGGRE